MTDSQPDIESLVSRIEQLEQRQNITAKYAVNVKRDLDELTEKFNKLQQYFEQQTELSNGLNAVKSNGLVSSAATITECVTDSAENIMLAASVEAELNADVNEIDTFVEQERSLTVFSDEEFKIARMTQLLNAYGDLLLLKAYLAEEKGVDIPLNAEEFWKQYNSGKRDFTGVKLTELILDQCANNVNLSRANLIILANLDR
jgi:tetrahydromethanopterin S-methyltransferase subunit F